MPRLKFLLFALLAIGLAVAHLPLVSKSLSAHAIEQAQLLAAAAPGAVEARMEHNRLLLLQAASAAQGSAAVSAASRVGKTEMLNPERTSALREAVTKALPQVFHNNLVVGFVSDSTITYVKGPGEPVANGEDLDITALSAGISEGVVMDAFDVPYVFYAVPSARVLESGEAKTVGNYFVGMPLLTQENLEDARKASGVTAVAVFQKDLPKWTTGKAQFPKATGKGIVERGSGSSLGPIRLPLFAGEGDAPATVGVRQAIANTPYEVAAAMSVRPFMTSLADYQQMAILGIVLLLIGGILGAFLGGAQDSAPGMVVGSNYGSQPGMATDTVEPEADENERTIAGDMGAMGLQAPEASPDDFEFPDSSANGAAAGGDLPELEPEPTTGNESLPPVPDDSSPTLHGSADNLDDQPTAAYPVAPDGTPDTRGMYDDDNFNPEQTRIAEIPEEIIRASRQPQPEPELESLDPEEQHFQDIYREFVATRERCGEPGDGLTYDKFAGKLRKNKESLVQKYNCRSVRFAVYVKEGKAALKATPVKD